MEKNALIVTDGAESSLKTAEIIAETLKQWKIISLDAKDFSGTELLPADLCFFGAENPNPPSFSYLYKMLAHINLAGRICGIFSTSQETAEYLKNMVHDSELTLYPDPFLGKDDLTTWAEKVAGFTRP